MFDLVVARPETEVNNDASCCGDRLKLPLSLSRNVFAGHGYGFAFLTICHF
jgi:hypothetical protein